MLAKPVFEEKEFVQVSKLKENQLKYRISIQGGNLRCKDQYCTVGQSNLYFNISDLILRTFVYNKLPMIPN